jgi:hypothetical protein
MDNFFDLVPNPPPTPKPSLEEPVFVALAPSGEYLVFENGTKAHIGAPQTGSNLIAPPLNLPHVNMDDATMSQIKDSTAQ